MIGLIWKYNRHPESVDRLHFLEERIHKTRLSIAYVRAGKPWKALQMFMDYYIESKFEIAIPEKLHAEYIIPQDVMKMKAAIDSLSACFKELIQNRAACERVLDRAKKFLERQREKYYNNGGKEEKELLKQMKFLEIRISENEEEETALSKE